MDSEMVMWDLFSENKALLRENPKLTTFLTNFFLNPPNESHIHEFVRDIYTSSGMLSRELSKKLFYSQLMEAGLIRDRIITSVLPEKMYHYTHLTELGHRMTPFIVAEGGKRRPVGSYPRIHPAIVAYTERLRDVMAQVEKVLFGVEREPTEWDLETFSVFLTDFPGMDLLAHGVRHEGVLYYAPTWSAVQKSVWCSHPNFYSGSTNMEGVFGALYYASVYMRSIWAL